MSTAEVWTPENLAPLDLRVLARVQVNQARQAREESGQTSENQAREQQTLMERIADAMHHPYHWARHFTKTFNPHWQEEGLNPNEPFPDLPYFQPLFDILLSPEQIIWIEKSRDMMVSWAIVAYFTWQAQKVAERRILFQTQEGEKVTELLDYAKCLYREQPAWLKEAHPLARPLDQQAGNILQWANGSEIFGIPGGKGKIRSYHPWGFFNDESAFQPYAGECYNEAISAVKGKIVFNSSAYPGWYADAKRDIVMGGEIDGH